MSAAAQVGGVSHAGLYQGARPEARTEAGSSSVLASLRRFPPRPLPDSWPETVQPRQLIVARLLTEPFTTVSAGLQPGRRRGLTRVLDWLEHQPGDSWQDRWLASGADAEGNMAWRRLPATDRSRADTEHGRLAVARGMSLLVCGDVIRPSLGWLMTPSTPRDLAAEFARSRDAAGFEKLAVLCRGAGVNTHTAQLAMRRIAAILAAKGGRVDDITVGDCLELLRVVEDQQAGAAAGSPYFYQLLRAAGVLGDGAPTARGLRTQGQLSCEQLIDRYGIDCAPVRDLLVDYLRERQPALDYASLHKLSYTLGRLFWRDLEIHHPGIASLRLPAEVATAWKQRIATKTVRRTIDGQLTACTEPRINAADHLMTVRAFYLDLSQWAAEDPSRWGPWVAPCPIRDTDAAAQKKKRSHRKSRMDQRTRERLPVMPVLVDTVTKAHHDAVERLQAAQDTEPGALFTAAGQTLRRSVTSHATAGKTWAEDPDTGKRSDLTHEEHQAFWTWSAVEVLRHTGVRIEELTELSHHSLIHYRVPATGELVPLLQIAPSKTDTERLLVISPELADVLSAIITRVRDDTGAVPLVVAYDYHERVWNPPMPLLFQRRLGGEPRPITGHAIRTLIAAALAGTGLTDVSGEPLRFVPHDFRRILITDAIMHGMPPHIAQLVAGHRDINVTMGYKAVYPEEVINSHRAFIARRRALRPSEEYRTPTDEEWEEFLGHFERRRVALGTCARSYATPCIHEHSCIRCPLLRPDPDQRTRLIQIRDNLLDRIAEAHRERWLGEVDGLNVSLEATRNKLAQLDTLTARRRPVHIGMPAAPT
ncbi:site-specific integrase [Rhodococcus opacus]|uniref:site-specific integrase n=1 Tax=Rhodococcus opacus TaxID=37919 RepID=UPI0022365DA3|nr:site-specific integrase [Rhodococcus opacus]MDV6248134.1 site-specific integrase [Rhodococcus opacus]UZG55278.1 site-specific integrase [Rhodococcus opacus]UZG58945.1 site-specific integrase [Rhodococcus opacus]